MNVLTFKRHAGYVHVRPTKTLSLKLLVVVVWFPKTSVCDSEGEFHWKFFKGFYFKALSKAFSFFLPTFVFFNNLEKHNRYIRSKSKCVAVTWQSAKKNIAQM